MSFSEEDNFNFLIYMEIYLMDFFLCDEIKNNGYLKNINLVNILMKMILKKSLKYLKKVINNLTKYNCIEQECLFCFQEIFNNLINQF